MCAELSLVSVLNTSTARGATPTEPAARPAGSTPDCSEDYDEADEYTDCEGGRQPAMCARPFPRLHVNPVVPPELLPNRPLARRESGTDPAGEDVAGGGVAKGTAAVRSWGMERVGGYCGHAGSL